MVGTQINNGLLCNKLRIWAGRQAIMALLLLHFLQEAWIPILSCFSIFLLLFPYLVHRFPFLAIIKTKQSSKPKLPPSPPKLPIIGHLHLVGNLPYRSLQTLSHKYGPLLFLQLGQIPTLVVSSAETAREVLKTHDLSFSSRHVPIAAEKISYHCSDMTFAPYGPYWRQARKICILELLSSKRVQSFGFAREQVIGHMIDTISSSCTSSIGLIDMSENLRYLTNTLLCSVAFGKSYSVEGDGKAGFAELIDELLILMGSCFVGDYFPSMGWLNVLTGQQARLKKNFQDLDDLLEKVIEDHLDPNRDEPEHEDLVDVLLRLQKESNLDIPLTKDHIKGILMDMYTAGSDTNSVTLEWAMAELVRNPRVMKKAQREVREIVEKKGKLEESDVHELKYLKSVVKEVLRLHPPGPLMVPRESREECVINGYYIPKKSRVFVNVWAIGRDPNCWKNPEEFWPERFDDECVDFKGQDFQFIPFGSGRRGCPGIHFAIAISELALAHLLHNFDWELPIGMSKAELDMTETFGLVLHMKYPLRLIATPYQPRPSCV